MNVTFACSECDQTTRQDIESTTLAVVCTSCQHSIPITRAGQAGSRDAGNRDAGNSGDAGDGSDTGEADNAMQRCLVCGCRELYVRKDFSQRLGLTIVVAAMVLSSITWGFHWRYATYGILFFAALIDVALYFGVGNLLQCYRCRAEYRGLAGLEEREAFSLETHEKFRQQAARLAEADAASAKPVVKSTPPTP